MTDKEILQKAIEIAMENGMSRHYNWMLSVLKDWLGDIKNGSIGSYENEFHINEIIFSHDFAKAFWGNDGIVLGSYQYPDPKTNESIKKSNNLVTYKYHLQQMVLEENPIQYLKKYI